MPTFCLLLAVVAAEPEKAFTSPKSPEPEYGHALSAEDARDGWIALFDGKTTFGWREGRVEDGALTQGETTSALGSCKLRIESATECTVTVGQVVLKPKAGTSEVVVDLNHAVPIQIAKGSRIKSIAVKPLDLESLLSGDNLSDCTILKHPKLLEDRQARWSAGDGAIHAVGGPGAIEAGGRYGDLVLQLEVRTCKPLVNGGVFFRAIPGDFMNGYEAQIFNACYDHDPGRPARYSTGAIDDRQLARRLVSRDERPFLMTVMAHGSHIATWVNGYQTVDWTDDRELDENPRKGRRLEPGAIQLQAHDPDTDVEFRRVRIGALPK